jgi:hypothetical protein
MVPFFLESRRNGGKGSFLGGDASGVFVYDEILCTRLPDRVALVIKHDISTFWKGETWAAGELCFYPLLGLHI